MFGLEAVDLARIQFAFTISFHIIFPAITIGLASYLAVLEGLWLKTQQEVYRDLYHFWSKIFAVNFGMGVVSGLVMAYQFGTNWSAFSDFAGSITGPLLTYEVLIAFFLEAGFLGVMLFGWNRVGPGLHFFSTLMVAIGTLISAFWILASNSWMQTPQGFEIIDGRVIPVDWFAVVFNPSFLYRLAHMATAAFVATAFFVGASAAWHLLRGRDNPAIRKMLSMAMWMALIVAPIQAVIGDFHGLNTLKHQPAKIAAIEGHWENVGDEPTPLILFGWPDMGREETRFKLEIPALGSLILTHRLDKQVPALKEFPPEDRPNSSIVFWSFRVMVGLGMLMVLTGIWSLCCGCAVGHRPALVQPAQSVLVPAGAGVGAGLYPGPAARGEEQRPLLAVRAHPGADLPRLQRPGHQSVAEHHPALDIHLGRRRAAAEPRLRTGRRAVHHPLHPDVHRLELLRVPGQGDP
ncbi:cytochrome bd ubiquinol oxidase, subunit I [Pseudomonas fluorescens]|uniref:Cytochrome bd ubiquinol oxidase, subunit I n=1 Tax=Pseudomonas fluorescens TaxID=294 RepID=A0A3S4MWC4_PSEFL|nr:cytochrome d ubiquinol oxidase subunit I [Pseudomonas benzenivorans]VEE46158.1 cytochrome bd ubiquinol oxidase, subunit I [Pseudomonas fluorescens]